MEIQQHDGVVVDVAGLRQGFAELLREREREVLQGRREAPKAVGCCPPSPLYIGPLGGSTGPRDEISWGGGHKRGRGCLAPQGKGELPLGFPTLGAWGSPKGGAPAH